MRCAENNFSKTIFFWHCAFSCPRESSRNTERSWCIAKMNNNYKHYKGEFHVVDAELKSL